MVFLCCPIKKSQDNVNKLTDLSCGINVVVRFTGSGCSEISNPDVGQLIWWSQQFLKREKKTAATSVSCPCDAG